MWGLPSRRSGLKAGGMVWYCEYVRIYNMCARHARDVMKAGGSVSGLACQPLPCAAAFTFALSLLHNNSNAKLGAGVLD